VIKNPYIRLRGGQLVPKSFKMALPSTIHGVGVGTKLNSQGDQEEAGKQKLITLSAEGGLLTNIHHSISQVNTEVSSIEFDVHNSLGCKGQLGMIDGIPKSRGMALCCTAMSWKQ
jgi:hypothetical protein